MMIESLWSCWELIKLGISLSPEGSSAGGAARCWTQRTACLFWAFPFDIYSNIRDNLHRIVPWLALRAALRVYCTKLTGCSRHASHHSRNSLNWVSVTRHRGRETVDIGVSHGIGGNFRAARPGFGPFGQVSENSWYGHPKRAQEQLLDWKSVS
jgi:hypothetical protein